MTELALRIDIRRAGLWVLWLSVGVVALGFLREIYVAMFGTGTILQDLRHIAFDTEHCLGSWYSSTLMIAATALLTAIGQTGSAGRWRLHWYALAVVFALMSLDESVSFHEILIEPLRPLFAFSSYLHFAWIVPGAAFVIAMAVAYIPFVFALPAQTRNAVIAGGAVYVTGALGFEAIGGHFDAQAGSGNIGYIAAFLIEETLEIAGLTIFLLALLADLPRHFGNLTAEKLAVRNTAARMRTRAA